MSGRALVFGASGALGEAILTHLRARGWDVTGTSRVGGDGLVACDALAGETAMDEVMAGGPYDAVVWANGANRSDRADDIDAGAFRAMFDANVTFVVVTLARLTSGGAVADGAGLVVLSSIWERVAREGKYSYTITKAAIGGLVRAASVDLAPRGIRINALLPSVIDTPMTRAALSSEQITRVAGQTGYDALVSAAQIASVTETLLSDATAGITGQSIPVDHGFTHARIL